MVQRPLLFILFLTAGHAEETLLGMSNEVNHYMGIALEKAQEAGMNNEVPVGAVLVNGETGNIVSAAGNLTESFSDPTAHAELLVIREGGKVLGAPRLVGCDLYVTLEPCPMCAQAISLARIRRLYFGAYDPKSGGIEHGARIFQQSSCHHRPEVFGGIEEKRSARILSDFFAKKRIGL